MDFNPEFNQLVQTLNGIEKVYQDPILQTQIQSSQLKSFLIKNQFSPPPIEFLVSISNSQAMIKNPANNKEVNNRVCKSPAVPYKIKSLDDKYHKEFLSTKEIKKIVKLLLKSHEPYIPNILSMNLSMNHIQTGVQGPECGHIGMRKIHGSWICNRCGHLSKDAHIDALKDIFFIFEPTIKSRQFSDFLDIPSIHQSKRLLSSMELDSSGTKKGRVYTPGKDFPLWE